MLRRLANLMKTSRILIFFLVGLTPTLLFAEDKAIQLLMNEYWAAWTRKDFKEAASFISPVDMSHAKEALLPVFLEARNRTSEGTRDIVSTFFGETSDEDLSSLSGEEVYASLNRIVATTMEDAFDLLARTSVNITRVIPDGDDAALIRYGMLLDGKVLAEDFERVVKINESWFLRLKEDPKVTARKFEMLFRE